jgi:hypothetical protein
MRARVFLAMVVLTVTCGPSPDAKLPGYVSSNGGSLPPSQGGATEAGGATGSGGTVSTGGTNAVSTGGTTGVASGGKTGTGGVTASGGSKSTGGAVGSGGSVSTGSGGRTTANGGAPGSGGVASVDGGRPPIDGGGSCVSKIISNGYACGTATACSACKDNGTSLETKCKAALDCFESKYPCTGNCPTECFNSAGASGPVQACVTGLTAACSSGGC